MTARPISPSGAHLAAQSEADRRAIDAAWFDAQNRRPYRADDALIAALTPPGGNWTVLAEEGAITRSIMWNGIEAANINPRGDLDDTTEGHIAMGMAATPVMDKALRSILVLAEDPANLDLIRRICISTLAVIERPAPRIPEPDEGGEDDDDYHRNDFEPEDIGERP